MDKCKSCHEGPLAWKNLVKEDRKGAASVFIVKCHLCGYLNTASTSMQHRTGKRGPLAKDVNTRLALGALNAGIGHTHVNSLLSCLDVPTVNHATFKTREREVGKAVELVANESCVVSCCKEREMAMAAGAECDSGNLVGVMCSYDMGWQKKGKAHNSSTGHGAVLGVTTGKVLDFANRNKTCRTCAASKKNNKRTPHDCRKNHCGSSKIMGSNVACELFKRAPARGIKYDKYIESGELPRQVLCILCSPAQKPTEELAKAIQCIVPHAFGDHNKCDVLWCRYKQNPAEYTHHELPYGKDLHGSSLQQALQDLFSEYASPTVASKLAPCLDSQRNESLNGTMGSKNLKVRHYGGSESSDFRTACGVAQHNEGHNFICKTLIKTGINPGSHCRSYQQELDEKVSADKKRKSTKKFKIRRRQLRLNRFQSTVRNENREGVSYEHNIGLNLVTEVCTQNINREILQKVNKHTCKTELKEYEQLISSSAVSPLRKEILFDPQKTYKFVLFDIETSSTTRRTELLQLSAITDDGKHSFSEYIYPERSITTTATAVYNITVRFSGDQRVLCKSGNPVPAKPLKTCLHSFTQFLDVCSSSSIDYLILLGHNASVFDTPRLLLNGGPTLTSKLNEMKVLFGDSLPVLKVLRDEPNSPLQPATNKLGDVYETLFSEKFDAHDALEDVKALRKILFTAPLQVPNETLVSHDKCTSPNNAFEQATFLERRQDTIHSYDGKLYSTDQGWKESLSISMIQKMADAGLSYHTLQALYEKYGLNGLYGVLALAPTTSRAQGKVSRVTANKRILFSYDTTTFPNTVTLSSMNLKHCLFPEMFNFTERCETVSFILRREIVRMLLGVGSRG
ncbi:uncharacterized protein [Acropora muricata]|uniref:uncharacterized protein n=1 Tax=Acropora muricata TaxID=159855 RepID=UPI0034E3850B